MKLDLSKAEINALIEAAGFRLAGVSDDLSLQKIITLEQASDKLKRSRSHRVKTSTKKS
jgi:hypothetical protein